MVWVLIIVLLIALVAAGVVIARQRRSQQLQEGFGPEYGRTLAHRGDRSEAESELRDRRERHERLEIREIEPEAREHYSQRWRGVQSTFVDQPEAAVAQADALVSEVMSERGYPVEDDFDRRAADISVEHPVVVENYRSAHEISRQAVTNEASTEDLRQAMIHFRALFDELLGVDDHPRGETSEDINQETRS